METAAQVLGVFLIFDLLAAFLLVGLVAIVGRRGPTKVPLKQLLGPLVLLALCASLIYGSLWMMVHFSN
ncbi:MAG: hypothetical protein K8T89_18680 [Planctomycetes bacterium]|nr:hypothetical protein [Planctomycetota bacterium]